jgi:hypothetical protein
MLLLAVLIGVSSHVSSPSHGSSIATHAAVRAATAGHSSSTTHSTHYDDHQDTKGPGQVPTQSGERPMPPRGWYFIDDELGVFRMIDRANCRVMQANFGTHTRCVFTSMVRE